MSGNTHTIRPGDRTRIDETDSETKTDTETDTDTEIDERESSDVCPECGGTALADEAHGERVCQDCGMVVDEDIVDRGPEWRSFEDSQGQQKSRVGAPQTNVLHDKGLSSVIGWQNKDAYGNKLSGKKREQMQRLRTWDERFRSKSARDRNLKQALGEVDRMASALGIPDNVTETASVIYRRALDDDLLPGRSIEAMATAALYAAARQSQLPRSLDDFSRVSRVDRREIARAYRYMAGELGLAIEPPDPENFLPRIASDLELPQNVQARASELLTAGKEQGVHSGKSPSGIAAAAIYAASILENDRVTQSAVSDAADVSEVTIRNRYTELLDAAAE